MGRSGRKTEEQLVASSTDSGRDRGAGRNRASRKKSDGRASSDTMGGATFRESSSDDGRAQPLASPTDSQMVAAVKLQEQKKGRTKPSSGSGELDDGPAIAQQARTETSPVVRRSKRGDRSSSAGVRSEHPITRVPEFTCSVELPPGHREPSEFLRPRSVSVAASAGASVVDTIGSGTMDRGPEPFDVASDPAFLGMCDTLSKLQDRFEAQCQIQTAAQGNLLSAVRSASEDMLQKTHELVTRSIAPLQRRLDAHDTELLYLRSQVEQQQARLVKLEQLCQTSKSSPPSSTVAGGEAWNRDTDPTILKINASANVLLGAVRESPVDVLKDFTAGEYKLPTSGRNATDSTPSRYCLLRFLE